MVEEKSTPVTKKWPWRVLDCLKWNMQNSPGKERKREARHDLVDLSLLLFTSKRK